MAKGSTSSTNAISIVLMALGIFLGLWGVQMSGSFESQISQVFSGSDTNEVITLYIGGTISFLIGLYMYLKK